MLKKVKLEVESIQRGKTSGDNSKALSKDLKYVRGGTPVKQFLGACPSRTTTNIPAFTRTILGRELALPLITEVSLAELKMSSYYACA